MAMYRLANYLSTEDLTLTWDFFCDRVSQDVWNLLLQDSDVEIDLGGFEKLNSDALLWLQYIFLYRRLHGKSTFIVLPEKADQIGYLKYLRFRRYNNPLWVNIRNPNVWNNVDSIYKPKNPHLIKLKDFHMIKGDNWGKIVSQNTNSLKDYFRDRYKVKKLTDQEEIILGPVIRTLMELIQNVAKHGGYTKGKGYGFVSFTPYADPNLPIRICFNDIGYGFKKTLFAQFNISCSNDLDAIVKGLLFRYFHPENGIVGLYNILPFIEMCDGKITIRSGDSYILLDLGNKKKKTIFYRNYNTPSEAWLYELASIKHLPRIPGTHINLELKAKTEGLYVGY